MVKRQDDEDNFKPTRNGQTLKTIVAAVAIFIITSWIGYISMRGITTNENVATVAQKIAVVEANVLNIKEDLKEIKEGIYSMKALTAEIRKDQVRREKKE